MALVFILFVDFKVRNTLLEKNILLGSHKYAHGMPIGTC